jgi:hypothetical protein
LFQRDVLKVTTTVRTENLPVTSGNLSIEAMCMAFSRIPSTLPLPLPLLCPTCSQTIRTIFLDWFPDPPSTIFKIEVMPTTPTIGGFENYGSVLNSHQFPPESNSEVAKDFSSFLTSNSGKWTLFAHFHPPKDGSTRDP